MAALLGMQLKESPGISAFWEKADFAW